MDLSCVLCVFALVHPVCEFCKLFRELALLMAVENMSHWGSFGWKLISAPFCAENEKEEEAHHTRATRLNSCFSLVRLAAAGEGGMCFRFDMWDVEQVIYCSHRT